jgi:hypothetical protein
VGTLRGLACVGVPTSLAPRTTLHSLPPFLCHVKPSPMNGKSRHWKSLRPLKIGSEIRPKHGKLAVSVPSGLGKSEVSASHRIARPQYRCAQNASGDLQLLAKAYESSPSVLIRAGPGSRPKMELSLRERTPHWRASV